jgi:glycosyltransferase involved in cell wall biosynthesis
MDAAPRLRVLQVIPSLWHGGLERVATSLTLALAEDPAVDRVIVCSSGGNPYSEELRRHGIEFEPIPRPFPRPASLAGAAFTLARILRRERPHVVHTHNPGATAAAALARILARRREIPIVASFHGVLPSRVRRATRALSLADLVIGVSPTTTRALVDAGLAADRTTTIFNAVAPEERPGAEVRQEFDAVGVPLVVTVGRYVGEKNQALLLEALAQLERPLRALIVGYGPREEELRSRADELGLGDAVVVTGRRDDAPDLIAAADVFALSSSSEALPLVLIEAMALGTPVVATAVGGVADVVADGRTGLLVPPGDAAALASAIRRVLGEPGLAERLRSEAGSFVEEHCSLPAMVAAYRGVYTDAIARRAGARPST